MFLFLWRFWWRLWSILLTVFWDLRLKIGTFLVSESMIEVHFDWYMRFLSKDGALVNDWILFNCNPCKCEFCVVWIVDNVYTSANVDYGVAKFLVKFYGLKCNAGPYAWVKHVPGEAVPPSQPNEGSVKLRNEKKRRRQSREFIKVRLIMWSFACFPLPCTVTGF